MAGKTTWGVERDDMWIFIRVQVSGESCWLSCKRFAPVLWSATSDFAPFWSATSDLVDVRTDKTAACAVSFHP